VAIYDPTNPAMPDPSPCQVNKRKI